MILDIFIPPAIEKLLKFLHLEADRGHDEVDQLGGLAHVGQRPQPVSRRRPGGAVGPGDRSQY